MSSRGFLYVTELVRDVFREELDKAFGRHKWELDGYDHDIWDLTE